MSDLRTVPCRKKEGNIQYARASVCTVLYVCVGDGDDVYGGGGSVCMWV